ncbi:hypothetical protein L1049_027499 [Liquidambar formosana]|uniref:Glycosyltransferase N-terminal domain-containing protein n=1 Tax=Liquidambar formosana TaxID=63359 RepID=A0AAP0WSJ5_LIQFO
MILQCSSSWDSCWGSSGLDLPFEEKEVRVLRRLFGEVRVLEEVSSESPAIDAESHRVTYRRVYASYRGEVRSFSNGPATLMTIAGSGTHILVIPFPAQGHLIPLLDLTHQLATRGLTITILVTPKNLPLLNPLLSQHPSIKTLVFPFPAHPSIPAGVENAKDLPAGYFRAMMNTLGELYNPLLHWFQSHPSPPVAIVSDMFLGWTHHLACHVGVTPDCVLSVRCFCLVGYLFSVA